jgi:hypothetical protein
MLSMRSRISLNGVFGSVMLWPPGWIEVQMMKRHLA